MLILASQSNTRRRLLEAAGLRFAAAPAEIDERAVETKVRAEGRSAAEVARLLAEAKAVGFAARDDSVVIGADQTLALGDALLHKPESLAAARAQLHALRGRTHRLHAGVALAQAGSIVWSHVETAELTMRQFSDAECDRILAAEGELVLASVSAYRLEGPAIRLFETIHGDYFTILGMPLLPLLGALRQYFPETLERS